MSVVRLSIHKNTRDRRHAKAIKQEINLCIRDAQETFGTDLHGYALVTWDKEGTAMAHWNGIAPLGACPIEEYTKNIITRVKAVKDAQGE